jgi:hypothetical protein
MPASLPPPVEQRPRRSGARVATAKILFLLLFGGVSLLLGYALKQSLSTPGTGPGDELLGAASRAFR